MAHRVELPRIEPDSTLPNPSFFAWLKSQTALFVSQFFGIGYVLVSFTYYGQQLYHHYEERGIFLATLNHRVQVLVDFAHIGFMLVCIFWLVSVLNDNDRGRYRIGLVYRRVFNEPLSRSQRKSLRRTSRLQLRTFKKYFLWFWFAMLALYLIFAFKHTSQPVSLQVSNLNGVVAIKCPDDLVNNEGGGCFNLPGPAPPSEIRTFTCAEKIEGVCFQYNPSPLVGMKLVARSFYPFLTFALNNTSLWFAFLCFTILYLPAHDKRTRARQMRLVHISGFVILIFVLSFPLTLATQGANGLTEAGMTNYFTCFEAVSGILNAVVLALLIARLDSKFIGLPPYLISVLYCYAAVQPFFTVFEQPAQIFQTIQSIVLIFVFLFKVYFFLIIMFTLQTGRMLNYLFCFPYLDRHVDSIFQNQFEIISHRETDSRFSFSIKKDNVATYLTDRYMSSRDECDQTIKELRERMKEEKSYDIKEQAGTHWIEVMDSDNEVICYSVGLKSRDETKDLLDESIERVPYCKYTRT